MQRKTVVIGIALSVASVLAGVLLAQAQESLFGTWKMNAAKSNFSPGPMPKSNIAKWEALQGGVKLTVDVVPFDYSIDDVHSKRNGWASRRNGEYLTTKDTLIAENDFEGNGGMAYGLERGVINIEH